MLERSSLGTSAARHIRYHAEPSEITAAAQLGSMPEQTDRAVQHPGPLDRAADPDREQRLPRSFWTTLSQAGQKAFMSLARAEVT